MAFWSPFIGKIDSIHKKCVKLGGGLNQVSPSKRRSYFGVFFLFNLTFPLDPKVYSGGLNALLSLTVKVEIVDEVGRHNAQSVFVTSDREHMLDDINQALSAYEVGRHSFFLILIYKCDSSI